MSAASIFCVEPIEVLISAIISANGRFTSPTPGISNTLSRGYPFPSMPKAGPSKEDIFLVTPLVTALEDSNILS